MRARRAQMLWIIVLGCQSREAAALRRSPQVIGKRVRGKPSRTRSWVWEKTAVGIGRPDAIGSQYAKRQPPALKRAEESEYRALSWRTPGPSGQPAWARIGSVLRAWSFVFEARSTRSGFKVTCRAMATRRLPNGRESGQASASTESASLGAGTDLGTLAWRTRRRLPSRERLGLRKSAEGGSRP